MRSNRFFSDIDKSSSIQYLLEATQKYCSEDYIVDLIRNCDGRAELRIKSYESSCYRSISLLGALYTRGDNIESLRPVYLDTRERLRLLEESIHALDMEEHKRDLVYPIKIGILVALGHALGESRDQIARNTRAISAGYDLFVDRLLGIYDPERPLADNIANKTVYKKLYAVFDASPEQRPAMVARYLDEWEKLLLKDKIPGLHYPQPAHLLEDWDGYWCYPAAAVVAALNIDDSSFIDHEFFPTDLMLACARYRGEPVILEPLPEPALPEPPKRSPRRKAAPEMLKPWTALFDTLASSLPKSLQNTLWNAMVQWLNEEWEEERFDASDLLCALSAAQWEIELLQKYRRLVLLHVDWKDDESALTFCADLARTVGIEEPFEPDPQSFTSSHRVHEVLNRFHQWLGERGYWLISPDRGDDSYCALPVRQELADEWIAQLEQAGLKVDTFADKQPL